MPRGIFGSQMETHEFVPEESTPAPLPASDSPVLDLEPIRRRAQWIQETHLHGSDVRWLAVDAEHLITEVERLRALHASTEKQNRELREALEARHRDKPIDEPDYCQGCGGRYRFDTSIDSPLWNAVIRVNNLPEYLCAACIVREFVKRGEGFAATLWGDEFNGTEITVSLGHVHEDLTRGALEAVERWTIDTPQSYAQQNELQRLQYRLWVAVKQQVERQRQATEGAGTESYEFLKMTRRQLMETVRIENERLQAIAVELGLPKPTDRQGYEGQHTAFTIIATLRKRIEATEGALRQVVERWRKWDSICNRCFGREKLADCEVCSTAVAQIHLAADELEAALLALPLGGERKT